MAVRAAAVIGRSAFVGRARELDSLRDVISAPGAVVVVGGGAGVGKSRLVREALSAAQHDGEQVFGPVGLRSSPFEARASMQPRTSAAM